MGRRVFSNSFAGGEMSPLMVGHLEDIGYRTGYERGRNLIVLPTGALTKRPQFEFVKEAKSGASAVRMFPFIYGDGDAYAMEWGPNHIRLHAEGETLTYATPIPVASVDLGTDTFTTLAAHGLAVNDAVRITHKGTSIPGNLATGSTYYVRTVPTTTTFTLSASAGPGSLLDLTTNSTIDETSFWKQSELPREYYASKTVTRTGNNLQTTGAHGLVSGDPFHLTTTTTLPPPLAVGTVYYVSVVDTDEIRVAPTKADGLAGTNLITLTGAGSGTHTLHYAYYNGDIVWGGSLTLLGSTSSRLFWCIESLTTALPTVADWYQMPADGTYELYTSMGAAALADTSYDQSFDEWTLCKPQSAAYLLARETAEFPSGSSSTADVIRWTFSPATPATTLGTPTWGTETVTFGENYSITWGSLGTQVSVAGTTACTLLAGDTVYQEATLGGDDAISGIAGTPGFYLVTEVTGNLLRLRRLNGGAEVSNTDAASRTGFLRSCGASSQLSESYKVTAMRDDGEEGEPTTALDVTVNLEVPGSSVVLTWTAVTGAARYRIYKKLDEVYGAIGETDQLTFTDNGLTPDLAVQPPTFDDDLLTYYPRAVGNFQLRQWFGGPDDYPRRVWGGRTGSPSTMSYHERVLLDTDRVRFDVAARERTLVRHIVPMTHLILLTSSAEFRVTGTNSDVLTPTSIDCRPLSQVGSTKVRPIVVNSNLLFVGARDGHVYEMQPQQAQVQPPSDLSVRSAHLFDDYSIVESAQQRSPVPIEWYLRSDGTLLGMTYMPEQNIRGWHVHTAAGTDAEIESICIIPDSDGDRLYASILRTIDGGTVRYIERMGRIADPATMTASRYLDSCYTYSGTSATSITGLDHLEGESVYAVADGYFVGPFTVTSGAITLTRAASTVHVGMLYNPSLRMLPATLLTAEGYGKGRQLNVREASIRVNNSCSFTVGVYSDDGYSRTMRTAGIVNNDAMQSKDVPVPIEGSWGRNAQIVIEQASALPLTIVSVTLDVDVGGP